MNPILLACLGLAAMFILILMHVPLGVSMATVGFIGTGLLIAKEAGFSILGSEAAATLGSTDLAVIPLFMVMGNFAAAAGISKEMYDLAQAFLGHRRGGLAMATVGGCGLFGAVCGSGFATTATFGRVALPEMVKRGYSPYLATGCIAGGGTLGVLVPPSIILVIYAVLAEQFIIDLFLAAIGPAILTILLYFVVTAIYVRLRPAEGPAGERVVWSERLRVIGRSWSALVLIITIGGGIYGGVFTVTEAASLGAILAVFFAFIRRRMTVPRFWDALKGTATSTGMIYVLIMGAMTFNYFIIMSHMPDFVANLISNSGWSVFSIMLVIILVYIALGCVFDTAAAIIITLPFVLPIITGMGYSPVWWGVVNVVLCEIGAITPPIGLGVFVLQGVAPQYTLSTIYRGIVPYLAADIVRIVLLVVFPAIAMFLPNLLRG